MDGYAAMSERIQDQYEYQDVIPWNETVSANSFLVKHTDVRTVVGTSCGLSILGSIVIILSYACFKERRTTTREILVHISVMDMGVALANLIGIIVYFDQYLHTPGQHHSLVDGLCRTQAFFAAYFTLGSVLWTMSLAVYLYFLILCHGSKIAVYFMRFSYAFCYLLPLLLALWLVLTGKLGYSPYDSSGWCSLISKDPDTGEARPFVSLFGNDLWIWLATVLIPLLYLVVRLYIHQELKYSRQFVNSKRFWNALYNVDYKFLLIPVVFIGLRIWTSIISVMYIYVGIEPSHVPTWINKTLIYLSGIGDSGQGFANAVLFVLFTRNVRRSFIKCMCCRVGTVIEPEGGPSIQAQDYQSQEMANETTSERTPMLYQSLESSLQVQKDYGSAYVT